jgi:hypothetical protein
MSAAESANVLARGDDSPGMAMKYYASRGETRLVWGGSGRAGLVRSGTVSAAGGVIRAMGVVSFRLILSRPAASVPEVSA